MVVMRYLDVVLVVIAAAPALALGAPALGYALGAGGWILQRIVAVADRRLLSRVTEPRMWVGVNLFESFGRIWLLAGAIVIAGVAGARADGLTAALVIFVAYSVAFASRVIAGPPGKRSTVGTPPGKRSAPETPRGNRSTPAPSPGERAG